MANGSIDTKTWAIEGLRAERKRTEERLAYLVKAERELVGQALTGTTSSTKKTAKNGTGPKTRKHRISPEARQKMREAAQRRWANKKTTTSDTTTGAIAQPETVPPPVA